MKAEFTAIIESAPEGGYWAICPEVPGANGQSETIEETKNSLRQSCELILEDRKACLSMICEPQRRYVFSHMASRFSPIEKKITFQSVETFIKTASNLQQGGHIISYGFFPLAPFSQPVRPRPDLETGGLK